MQSRRTTTRRFGEKMAQLSAQWRAQQEEARRLDKAIGDNLVRLGFRADR